MKIRLFIIFLITAALAVSCQKERVETKDEYGSGIDFCTLLTRGVAVDNIAAVAQDGGFRVWGYKHTGSWVEAANISALFDNTLVISSDNGLTWSYGYPIPWPLRDNVSFFAYAPSGCPGADIDDTNYIPDVEFTVNSDPASQQDFMIATPELNRVGTDPVTLALNHSLSRVYFSAIKSSVTVKSVVVTGVKITNIYYKGSTSLTTTPLSWSVDMSDKHDYTLSIASGTLSNVALDSVTATTISTAAGTLFLMPQTLSSSVGITVTFLLGGRELSWTGKLPSPAVWQPQGSYNYQLCIDGKEIVVLCGSLEPTSSGDWGAF